MVKYKDRTLQTVYERMLALAGDRASELYWDGQPRRGALHRCAFWDGFDGKTMTGRARSAHVVPGTICAACFQAGREFARQSRKSAS